MPAATRRILFPIVCRSLPARGLEFALGIARLEQATLVAGWLVPVPVRFRLDDAAPGASELTRPALEVVERCAARAGVALERRIEHGRSYRHALRRLVDHEPYDRVVVTVGAEGAAGLAASDIAWLLARTAGDVVVVRPADSVSAAGGSSGRRPRSDPMIGGS